MKKKKAECKCIEQVNDRIAESGVRIKQHMQINFSTGKATMSPPVIQTEKIESKTRRKAPIVVCTYCPFCGSKLE